MGKKNRKQKLGRNDMCPCGSGRKLKKCHGMIPGRTVNIPISTTPNISPKRIIDRHNAREIQRKKQQGLGKPIISTELQGHKFIAIGKEVFWSEKWKTFHDFLFDYLKICFEKDWWFAEIAKDPAQKHPIINWAELTGKQTAECVTSNKKINTAPMKGATEAYLGLSYHLYLIAHNVELQSSLIQRLKNRDQFLGAYYETFVAAAFIKAGFEITLEDESDSRRSHCEFTATFKETGKQFSVEAKARKGGDQSLKFSNQLYKALKKEADHRRIVFIELNCPESPKLESATQFIDRISTNLRKLENRLTIDGQPAPDAYTFFTNFPYHLNLEKTDINIFALSEGFKISDFKPNGTASSIREALKIREKHYEMYKLFASISKHTEIPSTFDGEIPDFVYGEQETRLIIGQRYMVPDGQDRELPGELVDATVIDDTIVGAYQLDNGKSVIASSTMTPNEMEAFKRHPDTFFGIHNTYERKADTALDLYDFFFDCYSKSSREDLLKFMGSHSDLEQLKSLEHKELVNTYCERCTYSALNIGHETPANRNTPNTVK